MLQNPGSFHSLWDSAPYVKTSANLRRVSRVDGRKQHTDSEMGVCACVCEGEFQSSWCFPVVCYICQGGVLPVEFVLVILFKISHWHSTEDVLVKLWHTEEMFSLAKGSLFFMFSTDSSERHFNFQHKTMIHYRSGYESTNGAIARKSGALCRNVPPTDRWMGLIS